MLVVQATDWLMMSFTKMGQLGLEHLGEWLRRGIKSQVIQRQSMCCSRTRKYNTYSQLFQIVSLQFGFLISLLIVHNWTCHWPSLNCQTLESSVLPWQTPGHPDHCSRSWSQRPWTQRESGGAAAARRKSNVSKLLCFSTLESTKMRTFIINLLTFL